jgi:stage IV sporulation protein B
MKKLLLLLLALLIPLNVLGYSEYIIPGGQTLGIEVNNDGVMIIGFYKINNKLNKNKLKVGDVIIKIEDDDVSTINELVEKIEDNVHNDMVKMTIKRDGEVFTTDFSLVKVDNSYKTGLYVKDSITGIGTLTYIDPETKIFGALGHEISESNSGSLIEVKTGSIFRSSITSIDRSVSGVAGSKNAKFYSNEKYGTITKNTKKGIYGVYSSDISSLETLKVGTIDDIKLGSAYIYTVLDGEEVNKYEINIDKVNNTETKSIHFSILSEELIEKTGGIVQGMSGSPIVQGDMIIGAVTHVIVDNPTTGYGILITNMLEEGEK